MAWMEFILASEAEAGNDPLEAGDMDKVAQLALNIERTPKRAADKRIESLDSTSLTTAQKVVLKRGLEHLEIHKEIKVETQSPEHCRSTKESGGRVSNGFSC